MPNGEYILNDLEFNERISKMGDRELLEFTSKLSYSNAIRITSLEKKINGTSKRTIGGASGIGAFIGAGIMAAIDYFMRR